MAEIITIAELNIDDSALLKSTSAIRTEIDKLKESQKELDKTTEQGRTQMVKNEATIKKLSKEYRVNQQALSQRVKVTQDAAVKEELLKSVLDKEVNSITEAREQTKILTQIRNDANVNTKEGAALVDKLNKQLNRNTDFVKDQADAYLKSKINIGNYKESILEAFEEIDANKKVLQNEIDTLEELRKETKKGSAEWIFYSETIKENEAQIDTLSGSMRGMNDQSSANSSLTQILSGDFKGLAASSKAAGGATKLFTSGLSGAALGMKSLTLSSLSFLATPIGLVLGALVVNFLLIKNAMSRSEDATKKMTRVFSVLSGIANKVLKALEPLGVFLIDTIVQAFEDVGNAAETAMELISDGLSFLGFDEASKNVDKFSNSIKTAAKDALILADAESKLVIEQRKSEKLQLDFQKAAEKLRQIRDDTSLTEAKRIKANEKLGTLLKQQSSEEIKIATLALQVADLRLDKEGETTDALEKRAEALTKIAEIEERITGQASEQLTNLNSLRKEASDKAIERQQDELEKFIASQGIRAKTLSEQLILDKQISDKRVEILKAELITKKVTQAKFDAEVINIQNERLQKQAEIAIESAQIELDAYIQGNQSKIDNDLFFSDESLRIEQERLDGITQKQTDFIATQLEQGVINQTEFNAAINSVNEENRIANKELETTRSEAEKEQQVVDLANKREIDQENFNNQFELESSRLDAQKEVEIKNAESTGANVQLIKEKYKIKNEKIEQSITDFKEAQNAQILGSLRSLLGESSVLGKAVALADITNTTVTNATKAFAQAATFASNPLTLPLALNAKIQGGIIVATGAAQAAKVSGVKFAKGGISSIDGASHEMGGVPIYAGNKYIGEAEGGEGIGILNKSAFSDFMGYNNSFNADASTSSKFAGGGIITQAVNPTVNNNDITEQLTDAIGQMKISVAVEDINTGQSNFAEVENEANLG